MKSIISIDKKGNEKLIGQYELFSTNDNGYHHVLDSNKKYGLINQKGNILLPCEFDRINPTIIDNLILVKKDGLFAFFNTDGIETIEFKYKVAHDFDNGIAAVKEQDTDQKYYLIDKKGEQVSQNTFDYVFGFYGSDLAYFKNDGKYGFINNKGEIKIECIYDEVESFSEGIAAVKINGYWGGINDNGDTVIEFKFDNSFDFREGLSRIKGKGGYGFIDTKGELVIPYQYSFAWIFRDSLVSVTKNGASVFIDKKGNPLNTFQYNHIDQFDTSGYARFTKDGLMGFMNKKGVEVVEAKFKDIDFFYEGLAKYKIKDKVYFINLDGEVVIERKCTNANKFQDGMSRVKLKNLYGFIDKGNNLVIDYKYETVTDFYEGFALAQKGL
jgi:hypothetical protein